MKKAIILLIVICLFVSFSGCTDSSAPMSVEETETVSQEVTFYFPDEAVMYLCPEIIKVNADEDIFLETVVASIINGPVSKDLNPSVFGDVDVLSVKSENGLCTVDLSSEFAEYNTGGTTKEVMAIYSIVNTLCSIDGVEKVKINIEGEENPEFGGHFSLDEPFEADMTIVKK